MPTRTAMMAMTTSSSIRVKARRERMSSLPVHWVDYPH
jgi:hypothetical protein